MIRAMKNRKILLLGGSSYVGKRLFARLGTRRAIATYYKTPIENGVYFDSVSMDLSEVLERPGTISHAVILLGDTNPETCAKDIKKSYFLNVKSIKRIIDYLKGQQIKPVFISSDCVFDGAKGNYIEEDVANPILTYGKQKLEVEKYLQKTCRHYVIARLSKVFGSELDDNTLFTEWLDAIVRRRTIRCAVDQVFSPIYVEDVVGSITRLIQNDCSGIFHVAGSAAFTRMELLKMLLSHVSRYSSLSAKIVACSIHDFKLREKRPLNISMVPKKLINATGIEMSDIASICSDLVKRNFKKAKASRPNYIKRRLNGPHHQI